MPLFLPLPETGCETLVFLALNPVSAFYQKKEFRQGCVACAPRTKPLTKLFFFEFSQLRGLRLSLGGATPDAGAEAQALAETDAVAGAGGMLGGTPLPTSALAPTFFNCNLSGVGAPGLGVWGKGRQGGVCSLIPLSSLLPRVLLPSPTFLSLFRSLRYCKSLSAPPSSGCASIFSR